MNYRQENGCLLLTHQPARSRGRKDYPSAMLYWARQDVLRSYPHVFLEALSANLTGKDIALVI
jgi:hypothetical protein